MWIHVSGEVDRGWVAPAWEWRMVIFVLVMWSAFTGLGSWIATAKNRPGEEGAILGLLFGPFGCLIEALLPTLAAKSASDDGDDDDPIDLAWTNPHDHAAEVKKRRRAELERHGAFEAQILEDQRECARRRIERREARREWVDRMVWRFGWFKALPDVAQPIVIGLAVALPIIALIVAATRP